MLKKYYNPKARKVLAFIVLLPFSPIIIPVCLAIGIMKAFVWAFGVLEDE